MTLGERRLTETLSDLAQLVQSGSGVEHTAESVVALARDNLECDYAGLMIRHRTGQPESLAVTDPVVARADALQYQLGEGPCIQAHEDQRDLATDDIATDPRWPRWGPAASELGLHSMLAIWMSATLERAGALSLYSSPGRVFTPEEVSFAHVFAQQAAATLSHARHVEHLQLAIDARTLIGQAQGVLMERFQLTPEQAFAVLRRVSQDNNVKLNVVAEELVRRGTLRQTRPGTEA